MSDPYTGTVLHDLYSCFVHSKVLISDFFTQKIPRCFCIGKFYYLASGKRPKKFPVSFIDPKKILFGQNFRQKKILRNIWMDENLRSYYHGEELEEMTTKRKRFTVVQLWNYTKIVILSKPCRVFILLLRIIVKCFVKYCQQIRKH